jgi:NAD(P)-dependent dehydrogenase (short-subunit alcohol dehydrogenase family)
VNAISPGPITTPLYGKLGLGEADLTNVAGSVQGQVSAGRFGSASEIAHAALFFASDESALTVGSELLIDGGMSNI